MSTWWTQYGGEPLSFTLSSLLEDVEAAFAETGADWPAWPNPRLLPDGSERQALEEEYSRSVDPGKYRIVWARMEAWHRVIGASELATRSAHTRWATNPRVPVRDAAVWHPHAPGSQPLVLARTGEASFFGSLVAVGDPAMLMEELPDCGCDACDFGSQELLDELDRAVISVIDGSVEATTWKSGHRVLTSFGGRSSAEDDTAPHEPMRLRGAPWHPGETSRGLIDMGFSSRP